ncbi:MAG: hypothetical protein QM750_23095 [Rubrivivax sp.]
MMTMKAAELAAGVAPESGDAQAVGAALGIKGDGEEQSRQYADEALADQACKADATLIARAALAGVELVRLADGTWLASKWGMFRPLATDAEAEAWLQRVGAPA